MDYKETLRQLIYKLIDPVIYLLHTLRITPNHITIIGLLMNVWAALHLVNYFDWSESFQYGDQLWGFGWILGFAGLMDMVDGRLARKHNLKSRFGAFFDSVVDRYSEFFMFMGIVVYFYHFGHLWGVIFSLIALMGSVMVSYNRSRAEALGVNASVGFMQRPERIAFIGLWSLLWGGLYNSGSSWTAAEAWQDMDIYAAGYVFMAIATNITAIRRLLYSENELSKLPS